MAAVTCVCVDIMVLWQVNQNESWSPPAKTSSGGLYYKFYITHKLPSCRTAGNYMTLDKISEFIGATSPVNQMQFCPAAFFCMRSEFVLMGCVGVIPRLISVFPLQVCHTCNGTVLNDTAVGRFCSSSHGRVEGRCCLQNLNSSTTVTGWALMGET